MKLMAPFDSAHQIGIPTLLKEVLTVDQGGYRWGLKNHDIGDVFASALGTRRDTGKRMAPFDSAHQIGLSTLSTDVLTLDQGAWRRRFKIAIWVTTLLPLWEPVEIR